MTQKPLHILKFGGTSMGSATSIRQVTNILTEAKKNNSLVVVCSAVSGVTNQLIQLTEIALTGNAKKLIHHGADVLVAGSFVFKSANPAKTIKKLKEEIA